MTFRHKLRRLSLRLFKGTGVTLFMGVMLGILAHYELYLIFSLDANSLQFASNQKCDWSIVHK